MSITLVTSTSGAPGGTGGMAANLPASLVSGNLIVVIVGNKPDTSGLTVPGGWTLSTDADFAGGTGVQGVDTGLTHTWVIWKISNGAEGATLNLTTTGSGVNNAIAYQFSSTSGEFELAFSKGQDTSADTTWSIAGNNAFQCFVGDVVLCGSTATTDSLPTYSSETLTVSNATSSITGSSTITATTNLGNDIGMRAIGFTIDGGGYGTPTHAATLSVGTNMTGSEIIVRIHDPADGQAEVSTFSAFPISPFGRPDDFVSTWDFYRDSGQQVSADVDVDAGTTTATVVSFDTGNTVATASDISLVTATAFNAQVYVQENTATFSNGPGPAPGPVPFGQQGYLYSTWQFYAPLTNDVSMYAGETDATVTAWDGSSIVAPNAGTTNATAVANDASKTVAPNAGTTVASVVASNGSASIAANAGIANATVTANQAATNVQPNAGTTTATVATNQAAVSVQVNAGIATATVTASQAAANVQVNADIAVVAVSSLDAIVDLVSDGSDWTPRTNPVAFGPTSVFVKSTWDFFIEDTTQQAGSTNVNADFASVTVTANNGSASVAPNAGTTTATVTANQATANVAPNASIAVSAVVANNASESVAVNAGIALVTATANQAASNIQPNAGTTTVTVAANSPTPNVQPSAGTTTATVVANTSGKSVDTNAGTTTATATANQAASNVQVNAGVVTVTVAAFDATTISALDADGGMKNGPAPIWSPLNPNAPSTWSFYFDSSAPLLGTVFAGFADVSVSAFNASETVAPNAGTTAAVAAALDAGPSVKVNAGVATVTATITGASIQTQVNANTTTATVAVNGSAISMRVNAGVATVAASAFNAQVPVTGQVNSGFTSVAVAAFNAILRVDPILSHSGSGGSHQGQSGTGTASGNKEGLPTHTQGDRNSSTSVHRLEG